MEAIWEGLRAHAEQVALLLLHKQLLDKRREAVEEGREELLDWNAIKDSLRGRSQA